VGEIFCRLNNFSNQDLVRRLEAAGAECWMADIAEWIVYTNMEEVRNLRLAGRTYSWEMIKSKLRSRIQHADEHALRSRFAEDFAFPGAEGEMVMNLGRSASLALHQVGWISRQNLLALRSRENFFLDMPFYRTL